MKLTIVLILIAAILACTYGQIQNKPRATDPRCDALPGTIPIKGIQCAALFYHYTYIKESNSCVQFVYGGCGGTANNFESQSECETTCKQNE